MWQSELDDALSAAARRGALIALIFALATALGCAVAVELQPPGVAVLHGESLSALGCKQ